MAIFGASQALATNGLAQLELSVVGLKDARGDVRVAICPQGVRFPDCGSDAVRSLSVPVIGGEASATIAGLPAGTYAVSVFHDANQNGKLDTMLGIPKEGFGFSANPPIRPRAPRFDEARIAISGATETQIRMRYIF